MGEHTKGRYGLRWQFITVWLVAAFLLLALLVIGEVLVPQFFTSRAAENNLVITRVIAARVDQAIQQNMSGMERLAALPGIVTMDPDQQTPLMATATATNPEIKELFVLNNDGNVIAASPDHPSYAAGRNYSNAAYFRLARETGKPYVSDVFVEGFDVEVIVAAPIKLPDGQVAGTFNSVLSMSTGVIPDYLKNLKIGSQDNVILVDRRGTLVWDRDAKRVLRQENLRRFPSVKNVVAGKTGTVVCELEGKNKICSYLPVKSVGWGLIVNRPIDEAFPNLMMIRIVFGVVGIFGLFLAGLMYWHGNGVVLKPMRALIDGINRVAGGDTSKPVDIERPREMAELADAFNHMVKVSSTFLDVSRALNSIANLPDMEKYALERTNEIFQTEASALIRFDKEGKLKVLAWRGFPEEMIAAHNAAGIDAAGMAYMFGQETIARLKQGASVLLEKEKVKALQKITPDVAIKFVYLFPLNIEGELEGVLMAMSSSETPFTEERVRTVTGLVDQVTVAVHRSDLYERLYQSYAQTTKAIARAINAKDPYNRGHSEGVAVMAVRIAQKMGLSTDAVRGVEIAAYLHDVGKIGISEDVLKKPAQLSEEEVEQIRQHPRIGVNILEPIDFPWPVVPAVEHHHERFNGEGYPSGLSGDQIPLEARILAVADAYESMVSDRPYRSAMDLSDVFKEFGRESGRQFDAGVVSALLDLLQADVVEIDSSAESETETLAEEIEGQEALALGEELNLDEKSRRDGKEHPETEVFSDEVAGEVASSPDDQAPRDDGTTRKNDAEGTE